MDVNIILKDGEISILLAAVGWERLYGFKREKQLEDSEIAYLIHGMVRRKILAYQDGKLCLLQPYRELFCELKDATAVLTLFVGETQEAVMHIYAGSQYVSMTDSCYDRNSIRLSLWGEKELLECLDGYTDFRQERAYPEELIPAGIEQENGICMLTIQLMKFGVDRRHSEVKKWSFYRGRYRDYVKTDSAGETVYSVRKDWSNKWIVQDLTAFMEEKKE